MKKTISKFAIGAMTCFSLQIYNLEIVYGTEQEEKVLNLFKNSQSNQTIDTENHGKSHDHFCNKGNPDGGIAFLENETNKLISMSNDVPNKKKSITKNKQSITTEIRKLENLNNLYKQKLTEISNLKWVQERLYINCWPCMNKSYLNIQKNKILCIMNQINTLWDNPEDFKNASETDSELFDKNKPSNFYTSSCIEAILSSGHPKAESLSKTIECPFLIFNRDENTSQNNFGWSTFELFVNEAQEVLKSYTDMPFIMSHKIIQYNFDEAIVFLKPQSQNKEKYDHTIFIKLLKIDNQWYFFNICLKKMDQQFDNKLFVGKIFKLKNIAAIPECLNKIKLNCSQTLLTEIKCGLQDSCLATFVYNCHNYDGAKSVLEQQDNRTKIEELYDSIPGELPPPEDTQIDLNVEDVNQNTNSYDNLFSKWMKCVVYGIAPFITRTLFFKKIKPAKEPPLGVSTNLSRYEQILSSPNPFSAVKVVSYLHDEHTLISEIYTISGIDINVTINFKKNKFYACVRTIKGSYFNQSENVQFDSAFSLLGEKKSIINDVFYNVTPEDNEKIHQLWETFLNKIPYSKFQKQLTLTGLMNSRKYIFWQQLENQVNLINDQVILYEKDISSSNKKLEKLQKETADQDEKNSYDLNQKIDSLNKQETKIKNFISNEYSSQKSWASSMVEKNRFYGPGFNRNFITTAIIYEDLATFLAKATSAHFLGKDYWTGRPIYLLKFPFEFQMFVAYSDGTGYIMMTDGYQIVFSDETLEHVVSGYPVIMAYSRHLNDVANSLLNQIDKRKKELKK